MGVALACRFEWKTSDIGAVVEGEASGGGAPAVVSGDEDALGSTWAVAEDALAVVSGDEDVWGPTLVPFFFLLRSPSDLTPGSFLFLSAPASTCDAKISKLLPADFSIDGSEIVLFAPLARVTSWLAV